MKKSSVLTFAGTAELEHNLIKTLNVTKKNPIKNQNMKGIGTNYM